MSESEHEEEVCHNTNVELSEEDEASEAEDETADNKWRLKTFLIFLAVDAFGNLVLLPPFWPWSALEGDSDMKMWGMNLIDMGIITVFRLLATFGAIVYCYFKTDWKPSECPVGQYHPNGDKKTKEEIDSESLEEPFWPWFLRFVRRPSFMAEKLCVSTQVIGIAKCLARMYIEIGVLHSEAHPHPVFWLAILWAVSLSVAEATYLQEMCKLANELGKEQGSRTPAILRNISSQLFEPLLSQEEQENGDDQTDAEIPDDDAPNEQAIAVADITSETNYKATRTDLLMMCRPDIHMIMLAFFFLILAAVAQVSIPVLLGDIIDSLQNAFGDGGNTDIDMWEIPNFMRSVQLLVIASVLAGVFAGLRGSIFTVLGARVNVRLRIKLMDSLLAQDIGFYDITKTGDITSRLSSDTTLVGDQVCLNVNVLLRSVVQAVGVLLFMFRYSWQLSIVAFISVPLITILSKWYGEYVRKLSRVMQKKLADGNAVSEAALSSMSTVRTFDAAELELKEFEGFMSAYLGLNTKSAIAYFGYATISTSLPELVFAVVVFYGGLLVRNGNMTIGMLVSFLLYLQSLSDAFATLGWVFSSLTQALGATDKVFELMHRQPRLSTPSSAASPHDISSSSGILGIEATKTRQQRSAGLKPENPQGKIELDSVELFYPARPERRVLNNFSLTVESGSTVALVGQSGGGKSSVMSLIQHLYEPSKGEVRMDGMKVSEISPQWLSRQISVVSQEPTLFARSIKRNISYGLEGTDDEPSDEDIIAAAKLANAHSFIEDMPQKYDTEVGERGVQLSGGQKQRIAIARALVRHPRVLLLDEATSALDAESEYLVQQAIDGMLKRGKNQDNPMTVIIVAHRLSTIQSADKIFVVKEGRVVEEGSHSELIQIPDGPYANLIHRQRNAQNALDTIPNIEDRSETEYEYSNHD